MSSSYADYYAARKEWTAYLCQVMTPVIFEQFKQLYHDSIECAEKIGGEENRKINPLKVFTMAMEEIPLWNSRLIEQKTSQIVKEIPNLKELLKMVCLSYIYVMSSVRVGTDSKPLDAKIPSPETFVHQILSFSSKELEPEIFEPPISIHKKSEIYSIITNNIPKVIRYLIRPEEVLGEYFKDISEKKEYGIVPKKNPVPTPSTLASTVPRSPVPGSPVPGSPVPRSPVLRSPVPGSPPTSPIQSPIDIKKEGMEVRRKLDKQDLEIMGGEEDDTSKIIQLPKGSLGYQLQHKSPSEEEEEMI